MHYKNGREAREGDFVIVKATYGDKVYAGRLHSLNATATTCNAQVAYAIPGGSSNLSVTVGAEVFHAEDAWGFIPEEFER